MPPLYPLLNSTNNGPPSWLKKRLIRKREPEILHREGTESTAKYRGQPFPLMVRTTQVEKLRLVSTNFQARSPLKELPHKKKVPHLSFLSFTEKHCVVCVLDYMICLRLCFRMLLLSYHAIIIWVAYYTDICVIALATNFTVKH